MVKMVRMKPHLVEEYRNYGHIPHYFAGSGSMNYLFDAPFKVTYLKGDEICEVVDDARPRWRINVSDVVDIPKDLDNRKVAQYV
jgi:hypothetical protein